ncbi:1-deoxy-D-xylulose-5-phosphate reductoisomerase [Candidatus Marinamargulisbacteria bacterium SCGC AG-410-N11]|nr:1-deoxy-D-xylulose-5-phosphate reductoisomerase [Candidatus Marinamargulisbacteria bacterium SCGC AG-410-N11]
MKKISILGSTGSIGQQTLDVIRLYPEQFQVISLSAKSNIELLKKQILEFSPAFAVIENQKDHENLQSFLNDNQLNTQLFFGMDGLCTIAKESVDLLVVAIAGTSAILPTFLAIKNKSPIGLACKEVLVSAGTIIMKLAKENNVPILPIDSEHAAIKQCLASVNENNNLVSNLILTASGGPFRDYTFDDLKTVTVQEALKHPNWSMGSKISIDSATLMNKGLEVIEAHHLFDIPFSNIKVVVHPQSIIHSLVEFKDGNVLAQMGPPDMRFPIQYVLTYPDKLQNSWPKLDLTKISSLAFSKPNPQTSPLLNLAYDMGIKGGSYPVVMNAANESAVQLFLDSKISFLDIHKTIVNTIENTNHSFNLSIEDIIQLDLETKQRVLIDFK